MKTTAVKIALVLGMAGMTWAGVAFGELSVSVTITGPVDEIIPLLQHLKDLGIGAAASRTGGPFKLEITSVGTPPAPPAAAVAPQPAPPPPPPPKPPLALHDVAASPSPVKLGGSVLMTARVSDPDHAVDTVAATIDGQPGSVELYDNATHGDTTAGDGIWSAAVPISPPLAPGELAVTVSAFNANGSPVMVKGAGDAEAPLSAKCTLVVQP